MRGVDPRRKIGRGRPYTRLRYVADVEQWVSVADKYATRGGIVEAFITGDGFRSPSVQCRIDPLRHDRDQPPQGRFSSGSLVGRCACAPT